MAVAVGPVDRHKKPRQSSLHMNFLFFLMSMVILVVMGISMWKDTHPEWLDYHNRFVKLETSVLLAKRADLQRQIDHPDYVQDYQRAKQAYLDVKGKSDAASSALEQTEADLEEIEVRLQGSGGEGESAAAASAAGNASKPPLGASKSDLDELDKEFGSGGSKPGSAKPATGAAATNTTSKSDLDELDKEFASKSSTPPKSQGATSNPPAKGGSTGASKSELDDLDKEFAASRPPKSKPAATAPAQSGPASSKGGSEMDELDKEFQGSGAPKATQSKGTAATAGSSSPAPSAITAATSDFEEADLQVDQAGAQSCLEAAQRDLLITQRIHSREMIGLPETETLKRQVSDQKLKEAQDSLSVAQADVTLEDAKAAVKAAALVCRWAADVKTLDRLAAGGKLSSEPAAHVKQLEDSKAKLQSHIDDLNRDLRLVNGRISRNSSTGPEVEQVFADRLGNVDRCSTCHQAVEERGFETAAEPFRTHSAELLKYHPIERFGCVSCHGGWGIALGKDEAHGGVIGKGRPLLVGDQIQSSCGKCHGETKQLSGESVYLAGAALFRNSGCTGCHKVDLGTGASTGQTVRIVETALPKAGPDLDRIGEKVQPAWLDGWLQNPQSHSVDARMPNLGLKPEEAAAISTYLLTQRGVSNSPTSTTSADLQRLAVGRSLLHNLGCLGCHTVLGEGMSVGPDLTNIRTKVNREWLCGWIQNPKSYFPNSRMPIFNLTRDQSEQIGDYLLSVGSGKRNPLDATPNLSDSLAAKLGANLIAERGCAGCHDIKGFTRISAPELTHVGDKTADVLEFGNAKDVKRDLYDYILTKITDPRSFDTNSFKGKMPKFGLPVEDARTIAVYLMSLTSQELPPEFTRDVQAEGTALVAGRKIFEQHDCGACHRMTGVGGKVGPELTREGEMVQPTWLFTFLKDPVRIRWWQDARMPNFKLSDAEASTVTEYLMDLSNQPAPYEYSPPDQNVFPLASLGQHYFEELKCQSCHPLGGKQGVAGGDTKKLGPDLGLAPKRLKRDWMLRFLRDPQAFSPGTQMPTFNKPDDQYSSIIDFLMKPHGP